uniref:Uncharacterized protein n=1 Tax=Cannabis sativa TaxID=3483 RepID=A0A803PM13_CANSA
MGYGVVVIDPNLVKEEVWPFWVGLALDSCNSEDKKSIEDAERAIFENKVTVTPSMQEEPCDKIGNFLQSTQQCEDRMLEGNYKSIPAILKFDIVKKNLASSFKKERTEVNGKDGFARKICGDKVDKVRLLAYGIFIIRDFSRGGGRGLVVVERQ